MFKGFTASYDMMRMMADANQTPNSFATQEEVPKNQVVEIDSASDAAFYMQRNRTEKSQRLYVFVAYSPRCPACARYKANIAPSLVRQYPYVRFFHVNTANPANADFSRANDVTRIPTFVFVKSGVVVDKLEGANAQLLGSMIRLHAQEKDHAY